MEIITKEKEGVILYQIRCSMSNELYHTKKWITLDEAKKFLINNAIWDFITQVIKIDEDFPSGYNIDGIHPMRSNKGLNKISEFDNDNDKGKRMLEYFGSLLKKFNIKLHD